MISIPSILAQALPFDGKTFTGRIAFSSDGNFNDEDDWGAFPMAIALLDAFGVKDKLVHVDYNNILHGNDARFYAEMTQSVRGAANRYAILRSILFDCQKDLEGATESIKDAINASSADNPLYFILAGPMEVPYLGIMKSDIDKRKFVYCISHSGWNDGYTRNEQNLHIHNKRDVIPSGIHWIQCKDGNRNLAHPGGVGKISTKEEWKLYEWLRDADDENLRWIFSRLEAEQRADISDATMTYFLLTGDEGADLDKIRYLLIEKVKPEISFPRSEIRIEAENFRDMHGFHVHHGDRRASKELNVERNENRLPTIMTLFDDIYIADGLYDIKTRYRGGNSGRAKFSFYVNDRLLGGWIASPGSKAWRTHTFKGIRMHRQDVLKVTVQSQEGHAGALDYVQLNYLE